ncbi:MAG: 3-isopropylmalate dehydratase small subunit [Deltaproteobacteria bacterium]|jgi:3-isopropylmalate/(R)-2-methylmalate dehydratase small subunit|nr:3-isopropylmalate dehydratase small subunit [Deltaproteobacteria bacterium]
MLPLKSVTSVVAPLNRPNVDTDLIIPKQFLISISREGFGQNLFHDLRYLENGQPNPDFILNQEPFSQAQILLAQENFGCGSSREHAAWALLDFGFKAVLAPSFGDIFKNNALNCGLAIIALRAPEVNRLMAAIAQEPNLSLTVNLESQEIQAPYATMAFQMDEHARQKLINGWDLIDLTLENHRDNILQYEKSHAQAWQASLPGYGPDK